jgi:hypothetical protein
MAGVERVEGVDMRSAGNPREAELDVKGAWPILGV